MNENIFPFEYIKLLQSSKGFGHMKESLIKLFGNDPMELLNFSIFILEENLLNQESTLKLIIVFAAIARELLLGRHLLRIGEILLDRYGLSEMQIFE